MEYSLINAGDLQSSIQNSLFVVSLCQLLWNFVGMMMYICSLINYMNTVYDLL